jgi:hypothetical protein
VLYLGYLINVLVMVGAATMLMVVLPVHDSRVADLVCVLWCAVLVVLSFEWLKGQTGKRGAGGRTGRFWRQLCEALPLLMAITAGLPQGTRWAPMATSGSAIDGFPVDDVVEGSFSSLRQASVDST